MIVTTVPVRNSNKLTIWLLKLQLPGWRTRSLITYSWKQLSWRWSRGLWNLEVVQLLWWSLKSLIIDNLKELSWRCTRSLCNLEVVQLSWWCSRSLMIHNLKQLSWRWLWSLCDLKSKQLLWGRSRDFIAENRLILYVLNDYFFGRLLGCLFQLGCRFRRCLLDRSQIVLTLQYAPATPSRLWIGIAECMCWFRSRSGQSYRFNIITQCITFIWNNKKRENSWLQNNSTIKGHLKGYLYEVILKDLFQCHFHRNSFSFSRFACGRESQFESASQGPFRSIS